MSASERSPATTVQFAPGWRARDVERQSTAHLAFADQDVSAIIIENTPTKLVYADRVHGFTLPAGRFLRVDQVAGRVYGASATPHLVALSAGAAAALADSVGHLLAGAGWTRVPGAGQGSAPAVAAAVRYASDGRGGVGMSHISTWRVRRGHELWAALPVPTSAPETWDGAEAVLTVHPVGTAEPSGVARLIFEVKISDDRMEAGLFDQMESRRARFGGAMQSLSSWNAQPIELVTGRSPR